MTYRSIDDMVSLSPRRPIHRLLTRVCLVALASAAILAAGATAQSRSFLWKATKDGGSVYLAGSVHMLSKDYYPLSPAFEAAFADSDLLVEELDLAEMMAPDAQMMMLTRGLLPPGQSLDTVVSAPTLALVSARVADLGLPLEPLKRFKPWALALTLLAMEWKKAGFEPELGLDRHFYDRARAAGREVRGLETVTFQISRFDELAMADQDRLLAQSLRELTNQTREVTTLATAWKNGDGPAIEAVLLREVKSDAVLYRRLIVERNTAWLPVIEALSTRAKPALVVVGAAHLVGPDGLLAGLRSRGYVVDQQ